VTDHGEAALEYAARGWAVLPCHHPLTTGCSCRSADCISPAKHPRIARGLNAASNDPAQIAQWWQKWPRANIGVRTGAGSGLVVIDVDPAHGGSDSLQQLVRKHGPLPDSRVVETGTRGTHIYFAHPGTPVRNDAGRRLGPGLDIRGDGGYIIAPPSLHAAGRRYRWTAPDVELAPLPDWLLERLVQREVRPAPVPFNMHDPEFSRRALEHAAHAVATAAPGTRNDTLNRAAYRVGRLVGDGTLHPTSVEATLENAAATAGLPAAEAKATIASGLRAGSRAAKPSRDASRPGAEPRTIQPRELDLPGHS